MKKLMMGVLTVCAAVVGAYAETVTIAPCAQQAPARSSSSADFGILAA